MPLSDPGFVVQYATGTVFNASDVDTNYFITLPSAATIGNTVLFFSAGSPANPTNFDGFYGNWGVTSNSTGGPFTSTCSYVIGVSRTVVTQTNNWEWYLQADSFANARHGVWMAVEIQGLQTDWQGGAPFSNDASGAKADVAVQDQNNDQTGTATTIISGTATNTTDVGPLLYIAPFVCSTTSATPPTVTGFSNQGAQAGTWQQLGASIATTDAGFKVRMDVAYKIVDAYGPYSCKATYSSAPRNMAATIIALFGDRLPPQQTSGRAATNSMM